MHLGIGILVVGLVLAFSCFAYGAYNMANHMSNVASGGLDDFGSMLKRHATVMVGMAFSGLIMVGGGLAILVDLARNAGF